MPVLSPFFVTVGFVVGAVIGALYFGGLWWSVMRIKNVECKKMFLFLSWMVRSVFLCGGLFILARYDSQMLIGGATGLLTARFLIVHSVKRKMAKQREMSAC